MLLDKTQKELFCICTVKRFIVNLQQRAIVYVFGKRITEFCCIIFFFLTICGPDKLVVDNLSSLSTSRLDNTQLIHDNIVKSQLII